MGKKDFPVIYSQASRELEARPTIKVSHFADTYNPNSNYAGVIVYHTEGSFSWHNSQGLAKGYKGRAFYVILQCTDSWPKEAFKRAGEGMVHDYLYKLLFDSNFNERKTCCGGFAMMKGTMKYSSVWLNKQSSSIYPKHKWESDGSKMLSDCEILLVDLAINRWKQGGKGMVIEIPDSVDMLIKLKGLQSAMSSPVKAPSHGAIAMGDRVRIRATVHEPKYNWGCMNNRRNEIGTVVEGPDRTHKVVVEFPSAQRWIADAAELEKVRVVFSKGMKVRLRASVGDPYYGIGKIDRHEVGVVAKTAENGEKLYIDFPSHSEWAGRASEMNIIC